MCCTLARGVRIEIRGFGSFCLRYRSPRTGRNPATGETVEIAGSHVPHFKLGKRLRDRIDEARRRETRGRDQRPVESR